MSSGKSGGRWLGILLLAGLSAVAGLWLLIGPKWEDVTNLPTRVVTRWVPPEAGESEQLRRPEKVAIEELGRRLDARVVWSSNRSGNHELYVLDTASGRAQQLTDHPHVDFASRFSPDGDSIVFVRSRKEWVSFREINEWDVYVIDRDGGEARLVAERGYHPRWTADGSGIVFHRGARILRLDLESGEEELLWDGGELDIGDPALDPEGSRLAMGVRGQGLRMIDLSAGEGRTIAPSQVCQPVWIPDSDELLWVAPEGNGGTRIMRGAPDGSSREVFMDLPGERSHEYFPVLSDDGRWLVWGATDTGHEHDRANYEIHVWEVGTDWSTATRLTFHTGNDQWPDIHVDG